MSKTNYFVAILLATASLFGQEKKRSQLTKVSHHSTEKQVNNSTELNKLDAKLFPFYHGVASGDPIENAVVIWTRVTPEQEGDVVVNWKISTDINQLNVVQQGNYTTNSTRDYTVKIDVQNLQPATTYYYSFNALGKKSPTGRTRTTPTGNVSQLRFAVVSCSNYQDGYFNVYDRLSERNDIDAVIHLGDYIYEYEEGGFGYTAEVGRGHEPKNEIVTLQDYRVRHSFYKLDLALRKAHQQHPFITIWDDHEFANDAYVNGAENHQPATEGSWDNRKLNAWKAYFEWMPIRENKQNPNQIYRKIKYGNLADLILLDTRIEGRDEQEKALIYKLKNKNFSKISQTEANEFLLKTFLETAFKMDNANPGIPKAEFEDIYKKLLSHLSDANWDLKKIANSSSEKDFKKLQNDIFSKLEKIEYNDNAKAVDRNLLGEKQYTWLTTELANSKAKWKILGNQVLMMPVIPLELKDTWNGYKQERDRLYQFIKDNKINNLVVITGDIHMTFVADLPENLLVYNTLFKTGSMGVEFVTPSVTSSNLDEFIGFSSSFLDWLVATLNPHIKKADLSNHGYFILDVKNDKVQADWNYVETVKQVNTKQFYSHSYFVKDGKKFLEKADSPTTLTGPAFPPLVSKTDLSTQENLEKSKSLVLFGHYPNPSSEYMNLHFAVTNQSLVTINLYNNDGALIDNLLHESLEEGIYDLSSITQDLSEGLYVVTIEFNGTTITRKIIVKH